MLANTRDVICRYRYDALDRLVGTTPVNNEELRRFYCKKRLATEIQGAVRHSIFLQGDLLFAQHKQVGVATETSLMATDQMRSVLKIAKSSGLVPIAYSPYGHRPSGSGLLSLLGFNGERVDRFIGHYLLGNGYRAFNPTLMRFNSPDSWCPFGKGGLNPYSYCLGDPINRHDESGHSSWWGNIKSFFGFRQKPMFSFSPPGTPTITRKYELYDLKLDADVPPAAILKQYKEQADKGFSLRIPITKVSSRSSLDSIPYPREFKRPQYGVMGSNTASFIYTQHEELFVSSSGHLGLSTAANSPRVVSAGVITRVGPRNFSIENNSGHFKPSYESLYAVKERLEKFGVEVTLIRHQP